MCGLFKESLLMYYHRVVDALNDEAWFDTQNKPC